MENYIFGTLGILVSVTLFLIGYCQTIGAKKERNRSANIDIEKILVRRIILETYEPSLDDLSRLIEGKARDFRVRSRELMSESQEDINDKKTAIQKYVEFEKEVVKVIEKVGLSFKVAGQRDQVFDFSMRKNTNKILIEVKSWSKNVPLSMVKNIFERIKSAIKEGSIVRCEFCRVDKGGTKCADNLGKEVDGVEVRGTKLDEKAKPKGKCIVCGRPAKSIVYLAKSY